MAAIRAGERPENPDGLALSSRNVHLNHEMRERALGLSRAIVEAGKHKDVEAAEHEGLSILVRHGVQPEYVAVRDAETLGKVRRRAPERPTRVLIAGRIDHVRLIDNDIWPGATLGE